MSGEQASALRTTGRARTFDLEVDGKIRRLQLAEGGGSRWHAVLDGKTIDLDAQLIQPGILSLILQGRVFRCVLDEGPVEAVVQIGDGRYAFTLDDPRSLSARRRKTGAATGQQIIKAPMPGRIVRLLIEPGQSVEAHHGIVVIEAMKMQNELKALRSGKVSEVRTETGATVAAGEVLVVIE